ncbi:HlyIII-domain-containing protein [Mytilinidion resinicola]|uniref:HlyIII-domain-containing protein n=1 Tax=Mytilinidion resinicola TaxID=574789 RepID=A0A6A6Y7K4_9PEZI|nr:HlyIII-domain-containing protein [Mytilinidion resinicola]KAF2803787.1 HlyIII-domain-containing protein [Mytilinidion resinicola]
MDAAKSATDSVAKVEKKVEHGLTLLYEKLPLWMQENHFIIRGYRPQSNSYTTSARSLGYLHNETVNIYSHLLGSIGSIISGIVVYTGVLPRYSSATPEDVFVFSCFFAGAAACMGMSAAFHTISNHSHAVASFGNKLDYLGIVFLIWGSFVPSIYYGFQTQPDLIRRYWAMITTLGAGTAVVATHPKFRTPALRPFRAAMFIALGLSAVFPVLHGVKIYGVTMMRDMIGLDYVVAQGFFYILGAVIYACRVPERLSPGTFDIWGSSHQIFHFFVVLAAATHLVGLLKAFDYEHERRDSGYTYGPGHGGRWSACAFDGNDSRVCRGAKLSDLWGWEPASLR